MAVNIFVIHSLMIVTWAGFAAFILNYIRIALTILWLIFCIFYSYVHIY